MELKLCNERAGVSSLASPEVSSSSLSEIQLCVLEKALVVVVVDADGPALGDSAQSGINALANCTINISTNFRE